MMQPDLNACELFAMLIGLSIEGEIELNGTRPQSVVPKREFHSPPHQKSHFL
jgi:hypothetical protein